MMKYLHGVTLTVIAGLLYTFVYTLLREIGIRPKGVDSLYTASIDIISAMACVLVAWFLVIKLISLDKKKDNT